MPHASLSPGAALDAQASGLARNRAQEAGGVDQIKELEQRACAFEARLDRFLADLGELVAVAGLRRNAGGNIALSTAT